MISAILPAAGKSKRMGGVPKELLSFSDTPLILYSINKLYSSKIEEVIVILGENKDLIFPLIRDKKIKIVINSLKDSNMLDSVRLGLREVYQFSSGILVMPVDSSFAKVETIISLLNLYKKFPQSLIRPFDGKRGGHPLLIPKRFFKAIFEPDLESLRHLLKRESKNLINMDTEDKGAFWNLNTPFDYHQIRSRIKK